jgi:hypothetical protein
MYITEKLKRYLSSCALLLALSPASLATKNKEPSISKEASSPFTNPFDHLPDELDLHILRFLKNTQDIKNERQSCKKLSSVGVEVLYENIHATLDQLENISKHYPHLVRSIRLKVDHRNKFDETQFAEIIQCFPKLKTLNLSDINLKNLKSLESLVQLQKLYLNVAPVNDLSPLQGLKQLKQLYLFRPARAYTCPEKDFSPLQHLTQLEVLHIQGILRCNPSFITELTQLKELSLQGTHISNISFLENLTQLRTLNLAYANVKNISCLNNL